MFVQIIQGRLKDPDIFLRQMTAWPVELKSGAIGYLGSTWGITDDGHGVISARFSSEETMRANDDRPEQDAWWHEMEQAFESVAFRDCPDVDLILGGGSDEAGFVQVIQGRMKDFVASRGELLSLDQLLRTVRPDVLGGVVAWDSDAGDFTQVMYFTSEGEARVGESSPVEDEMNTRYADLMAVPPRFFDLRAPHFD